MAVKKQKRNLGRGLSALIPDVDMTFLSQIVREEPKVPITIQSKKPSGSKISTKAQSGSVTRKKVSIGALAGDLTRISDSDERENAIADLNMDVSTSTSPPLLLEAPANVPADLKNILDKIEFVDLNNIEANPYQPRKFFSPQELEDLVNSLREHGVLQPVILRPLPDNDTNPHGDKYQLIAGERRWRAAQAAGLPKIPAIIRLVTDQQALELALIENVQRHDISALDAAIAYRRLSQEFALSQEQVAQRVGKSRSSIANTIRLLDLPVEAQRAIEEGILSEGHGRAILLASSDGARRAVLRRVLRDKLSVRDAEELARKTGDEGDDKNSQRGDDAPLPTDRLSPEARRLEESLQKHLGTRVKLKLRRQGGQILIQYFSNEELERLLKLIIK